MQMVRISSCVELSQLVYTVIILTRVMVGAQVYIKVHIQPNSSTASGDRELAVNWAILQEHCPRPAGMGPKESRIKKPRSHAEKKAHKKKAIPYYHPRSRSGARALMYTCRSTCP